MNWRSCSNANCDELRAPDQARVAYHLRIHGPVVARGRRATEPWEDPVWATCG